MRIGICDDDKLVLPKLKQKIRYYSEEVGIDTTIFCFHNENELLEFLKGESIDLLFLDIEMPGMGGIALADKIAAVSPDCQIAFCTNYLEYAPDVYEVKHCYYVLKDEFSTRLPLVLRKVKKNQCSGGRISVKINRETSFIDKKDIIYIERKGKYSFFNLIGGKCLRTMKKMDEILMEADDPEIIRCHTSYIIALPKVKKYGRQIFIMEDGTEIPISRTYREKVKQAFIQWNWLSD